MGTAIKHPVPDRVKPPFVIFDIRALWCSGLSVRVPGWQELQMTAYPVWHTLLYSCTHYGNSGRQWDKKKLRDACVEACGLPERAQILIVCFRSATLPVSFTNAYLDNKFEIRIFFRLEHIVPRETSSIVQMICKLCYSRVHTIY